MKHIVVFFSLACFVFLLISPLEAKTKREQAQVLMKKMAKSRDDTVRANAAWNLGQIGAIDAVPALIIALEDKSKSVRANAAGSLWKLGEVSKPAIPALKKALEDQFPRVISNSAGALVMLGIPKSELVPTYKRLLAEKRCVYRISGMKGLFGQVPPSELFHDALECSRDDELDNRFKAGDVLRALMDEKDRTMIPLILEALRESGDKKITDLVLAIVRYKPPVIEAVPILEKYLLLATDPETRGSAAYGLKRFKENSLPALPSLVIVLESDPDKDVRAAAAEAIGGIGRKAKEAVPDLIKAAEKDRWPKVRQSAIQALGAMGKEAHDAIPVLTEALKDPDVHIRNYARSALNRVDPGNKATLAPASSKPPARRTPAKINASLFADVKDLAETLSAKVPVVYGLNIYKNFAMATAPEPTSSNGYGTFTYRNGAVSGPADGHVTCKKPFQIKDVDFSIMVPLVKKAPGHTKTPDGSISYVSLGRGVFCKNVGWYIYVKDGSQMSYVQYTLDGKMVRVTP